MRINRNVVGAAYLEQLLQAIKQDCKKKKLSVVMEEPSAGGAVTAEEGGLPLSGHTYLPGTASLVQEIDSKQEYTYLVLILMVLTILCRSDIIRLQLQKDCWWFSEMAGR